MGTNQVGSDQEGENTMVQKFDKVLIGEALVGEGPEIAHIDLVIGARGSSVEQAFVNSLAMPRRGHTPLLAVITPNLPARPSTLMVNKVTMKHGGQAVMMFGPAQHAVAMAVMDSVAEGIIPKAQADDLLLIVSVFIEWDAKDSKKVHDWNYAATRQAIKNAIQHDPGVDEILAKKDTAKHPFY
jgi:5,6,7,8-tetrahydromethanopterin hydro-lyase